MSTPLVTTAPQRPAPPVTSGGSRRRWPALVAWLAAGWLATGLAQWARVDWLLIILAVVGLAGLLRGGRGPVARFVLALALLYSLTCVGGLLFSVWPWGLHPVPVAGLGFTLLVFGYALTGRRFSLPSLERSDLFTLLGTAGVASVVLWPMLRRDRGDRLALFMHVEDFLRHLLMYDTVRAGGGYLFLHVDTAVRQTGGIGFDTYPTGGHFVFGLTENFLRSGTAVGSPLAWADDFLWLHAASYIGVGLGVLWGARHIAGPAAAKWRGLPMLALVAVLLAVGPPIRIFDRGYPQETTALALLAVLVAILVRPLAQTREQLVIVAALLAGVSFSYYLFLPVALVMTVVWLVAHQRRLLGHWIFLLGAAVAGVAGMAVIPYLNWKYAPPGQVLLQQGQVAPIPGAFLYGLAALALVGAGALVASGWHGARLVRAPLGPYPRIPTQRVRSAEELPDGPVPVPGGRSVRPGFGLPVGWVGLAGVLTSLAFVLGVGWYQHANGGADYFDVKLEHQLMIICLVLCGGLARVAGRSWRVLARRLPARLQRVPAGAAASAAALVLVLCYALLAPAGAAPGRTYARGATTERPAAGEYAYAAYAAHPTADGTTTVLLVDSPWASYMSTVYLGIFQHNYPAQYAFAYQMRPWTGAHPTSELEQDIAASQVPIRVYSDDPATRAELTTFAATLPAGKLTVLDAATLR